MEEKQLFQKSSSSYGAFFQSSVRTTLDLSSSLLFNLLRLYSYFTLVKLVSGDNSPDTFTFIQNSTYFLFKASGSAIPGAGEQGYVATLKAFKSIVNGLQNNELGPITQYVNNSIHTLGIWSIDACKANLELESNGTESATVSFLSDFVRMVKNDSAFIEAKKLCVDMTFDLKIAAIVFGAIILVFGIAACMLIFCCPTNSRREGYESIGEGSMAMQERNESPISNTFTIPIF